MVPSGVTCPDVEKLPHQALDAREIGLQALLVHPVVVEVRVAGLGRAKGHWEEPVARAFRQVQERPTAVGVPVVGKAVAGAVRLEGLAGRAPQLLGPWTVSPAATSRPASSRSLRARWECFSLVASLPCVMPGCLLWADGSAWRSGPGTRRRPGGV